MYPCVFNGIASFVPVVSLTYLSSSGDITGSGSEAGKKLATTLLKEKWPEEKKVKITRSLDADGRHHLVGGEDGVGAVADDGHHFTNAGNESGKI